MEKVTVNNKEVAEVKIGRYSVTLDKDKLESLSGFCERDLAELDHIREMMDMLLDMCMGYVPEDADFLRCLKYLKCIRSDYEFLQKLGVTVDRN